MAQSTGITVLAKLTPRLFAALGYGTVLQLGLSLAWTGCLFLGCFVNVYLIDRVGRVKLLSKYSRYPKGHLRTDNRTSCCWLGNGQTTSYRGRSTEAFC